MLNDNRLPIDISNFKNLDIWKIEADQDRFLKEYFIETPAFDELMKTNKYVIIWRKGTWKSALKEIYYDKHKSNANCLIEDFKFSTIFSSSFFDELIINYSEHNKSYIDLIKYILLIRIMLLIEKDQSIDNDFSDSLTKFLKINWYKLDSFSSILKTVKDNNIIKISSEISWWLNIWLWNINWKIWIEKGKNWVIEIEYNRVLDNLIKIIFSGLNKNNNYILLIDKIDDLRTTYFKYYDNVVLNFLKAVNEINYELRNYINEWNKSRIIIFLREDLLNRLRGKDTNLNKIIQDDLIKIDWQWNYEDKNSLLNEMINKRISKAIKLINKDPDLYKEPFIENVLENSNIMRSLKSSQFRKDDEKSNFFKRILYNRTYLRPRDFLKYFHFLSISTNIIEFQNKYSDYLWEEIDNELNPILFDIERTKRTLKKICQGKSGKFSSEEFIQSYLLQNFRDIKEDSNPKNTAEETLDLLYQYSVIWNRSEENIEILKYWEKKKIIKKDVRFKYRETNKTDFDTEKKCIIHAWLYQALWITLN